MNSSDTCSSSWEEGISGTPDTDQVKTPTLLAPAVGGDAVDVDARGGNANRLSLL
jgi:hypothetical protein